MDLLGQDWRGVRRPDAGLGSHRDSPMLTMGRATEVPGSVVEVANLEGGAALFGRHRGRRSRALPRSIVLPGRPVRPRSGVRCRLCPAWMVWSGTLVGRRACLWWWAVWKEDGTDVLVF